MNRQSANALVVGLAFSILSLPALALGLEQKGPPDASISTMPTYGMEVPARTALKSVLPAGWQLFVHQSAKLPETLSWKMGDPWPKVLADLATQRGLAALIDWDARTVLIRTEEVAVQERATRQEIAQAAVTPLPKFKGALTDKQQAKREAVAQAASPTAAVQATTRAVELTEAERMAHDERARQDELARQTASQAQVTKALPVIRSNPTPQMVTAQEAAAAKNPAKPASTTEFSYTQPVALNKPRARQVAQAIATKFNLRLVWAAPELQLQGPVTLLARTAAEDARLLQKALGVFSPVVLELSTSERVLRALPRELAGRPSSEQVILAAAAGHDRNSTAEPALTAPPAAAVAQAAVDPQGPRDAAASSTAAVTPAPKLSLTLAEKEPLEDALVRFARTQGYTLEWRVEGGYEANRAMSFEGETLAQVLAQMLPPLGVSADIYTRDKHIVVRPGEARDR